jgi:hypothetical protein
MRSRSNLKGNNPVLKFTVFWDVAPCILLEVYQSFRGACCLHHEVTDYGCSKHLWNVSKLLPDYIAKHPTRHSSSSSPPSEPEFSTRPVLTIVFWRLLDDAYRDEFWYFIMIRPIGSAYSAVLYNVFLTLSSSSSRAGFNYAGRTPCGWTTNRSRLCHSSWQPSPREHCFLRDSDFMWDTFINHAWSGLRSFSGFPKQLIAVHKAVAHH